jgi:hypothetical protein
VSVSAGEIDRAWAKLEMVIQNGRDRHALFYYNDALILRTKRSFGSGKLEGNIGHFIRQQMKLNDAQFRDLLACPLSRAGYVEILRGKGLLPPDEPRT